jgi:hypothetical protein
VFQGVFMRDQIEPWQESNRVRILDQERRSSVRYLCTDGCFAAVQSAGDVCLPAHVLDVSREGLGLILPKPVAPETILGVELHAKRRDLPCFLLARVIHVAEQTDGTWLVGCHLTRRLTCEEVISLT